MSATCIIVPNLVQIRTWRSFWENRWNITKILYINTVFFGNSSTGQTGRRIFILDGSNDVDSRRDVPFGDFVYIVVHLRDQIPPNPRLLGRVKNVWNIETSIFSKLLHRLQPNFAQGYKDHQVTFVGGPNMPQTNQRWQMTTIFKNRYISTTDWISTKFGIVVHLNPPNPSANNIWEFLKSKIVAAAVLKIKKSWYLKNCSILTKFGTVMQLDPA